MRPATSPCRPVRRINVDASLTAGMATDVTLPGGLTGRVTATAVGELHVMEAAANTAAEPSDIVFNLLTDISVLSADAAVPSTVCLPTTGVPTGVEPILFHLADAAAAWEEIGPRHRHPRRLRLRDGHHLLALRGGL